MGGGYLEKRRDLSITLAKIYVNFLAIYSAVEKLPFY